jgi:hypothetical protein
LPGGIRSTALRSTGTACPPRPDAISRSHASARFWTVCEYSRRPADNQDHDCDKACLYSSTMRQPSDLDSVVETILVDAYGDDEQYVSFLTVIEEETRLPAAATLLGAPVTVTGFDYTNEARGLVAICEGSDGTGEVALADLAFPPDTVTAWIHAAYRHYLGLQPFPARPRPDWTWPD